MLDEQRISGASTYEPATVRGNGWPLVLAVVALVTFGAWAVARSVARQHTMALPGSAFTLIGYGVLGLLALRGREWARWIMFTLVGLTAMTTALFTFVSMGDGPARFSFSGDIAVVAACYILAAIGLAWPRPRVRVGAGQMQRA